MPQKNSSRKVKSNQQLMMALELRASRTTIGLRQSPDYGKLSLQEKIQLEALLNKIGAN